VVCLRVVPSSDFCCDCRGICTRVQKSLIAKFTSIVGYISGCMVSINQICVKSSQQPVVVP
jgi:hypothetical protein